MLIASCCFSIQQCHEMPWIEFLSRAIWHLAVFFFPGWCCNPDTFPRNRCKQTQMWTVWHFLAQYETSVEPPPMTTSKFRTVSWRGMSHNMSLVVDTTNNKTCCSSHFFSQASKKKTKHSWGLSPHRAAERDYCDIGDRTYFSTWIWWRTFFRDLGYWNRWGIFQLVGIHRQCETDNRLALCFDMRCF